MVHKIKSWAWEKIQKRHGISVFDNDHFEVGLSTGLFIGQVPSLGPQLAPKISFQECDKQAF